MKLYEHNQKNTIFAEIRDWLLPKLMNGKIKA
jgi:hypothetical protein